MELKGAKRTIILQTVCFQQYFEDTIVITGHTLTQYIAGNPNPGRIYRHKNHIAIDCGCSMPGGRLAAICLETGEEFYADSIL